MGGVCVCQGLKRGVPIALGLIQHMDAQQRGASPEPCQHLGVCRMENINQLC